MEKYHPPTITKLSHSDRLSAALHVRRHVHGHIWRDLSPQCNVHILLGYWMAWIIALLTVCALYACPLTAYGVLYLPLNGWNSWVILFINALSRAKWTFIPSFTFYCYPDLVPFYSLHCVLCVGHMPGSSVYMNFAGYFVLLIKVESIRKFGLMHMPIHMYRCLCCCGNNFWFWSTVWSCPGLCFSLLT